MASLRALATCIGLGGNISVLRDFLGFFRGTLPPDPTGASVQVSLNRQARLLQGTHFHLNVIAVGVDNFTDTEDIQIDYSIHRLRDIFNQIGVGVGRVLHWGVPVADANGLDSPTTEAQVERITTRWTVPNNGLDLFIPFNMNVSTDGGVLLGMSARPGPCEDKRTKGMQGSVSGLWGREQTARTVAHEIGHYFSLRHNHGRNCPTSATDRNNLMAQSRCAASTRNSVVLTAAQGRSVRRHCMIRRGC
jgi:hypothetical protein